MRYLVASDLHGSYVYTSKIIDIFNKEQCDKIILLGDLLYHGPRNDLPGGFNPQDEAKLLNEYADQIIAVRGNCDAEVDQMVLDFDISRDHLVIEDNKTKLLLTHGHHIGPDNLPPIGLADVMFFGHFHETCDYKQGNLRLINPGSTSLPKGNSVNSCIIYEDGNVRWFNLNDMKEYTLE